MSSFSAFFCGEAEESPRRAEQRQRRESEETFWSLGRHWREGERRDREETERGQKTETWKGATESQRNYREVPGKRQLTQI